MRNTKRKTIAQKKAGRASRPVGSLTLTQDEQIYGIIYLLVQWLILPGAIYTVAELADFRDETVLNLCFYGVNFLCCILIFHRLLWKSLVQCARNFGAFLVAVVVGFGAYWCLSFGLDWCILRFFPGFTNVNDASISQMLSEFPLAMAVGTVLLAPVAEECMFRGLLLLGPAKISRSLGFFLSVLAFCAIHVIGYVGLYPAQQLALCFVQYIPAGACLAWACLRADNLMAPIVIHSAINLVGVLSRR